MPTLTVATVETVPLVDLQNLRWMVTRLIPHLDWRHTGLGALQGYVREGDVDELRVHLWHSSLTAPGIDASGAVHDHRFDLDSTVLLGSLLHVEHSPKPSPTGLWRMHSVVHARRAAEMTGSHHLVAGEIEERYDDAIAAVNLRAGHRYRFPKRLFHQTQYDPSGAVTLVRKLHQTAEPPARVMHPAEIPVVHAFENPLPRSRWEYLLGEFADRLSQLP